jgi:hypothetical protein
MNSRNREDRPANFKPGSLKTSLLKGWHAMWDIEACRMSGSSLSPLLFELFVALSLCVAYFFLVRNYFAYGDPMSSNVFTAGSEKLYRMDQPIIGDVWKGRLSGLLLSGALIDFSLKEHNATEVQMGWLMNVFGLYHAFWLLLLFLAVIFALRHSLLINLGIFAGLIYNFSPAAGPFFYSWDIPATLFFTLAVLFFERRQMWSMAAATCAGCFFKETVLVCALLTLFASHWKWNKRMLMFFGIIIVYVLGKKFLLSQLDLRVAAFSMDNASNFVELLRPTILIYNLKVLFSQTINHVIFANAGTLAAVLVLGWRKRFLPYMTLIIVFLAGQFMYGMFNEFRIFMEVLPLSLILLSERWREYTGSSAVGGLSAGPVPAWAVRNTFPALLPMTVVLIVLSTGAAAWRYHVIFEDLQHPAPSGLGQYVFEWWSAKAANLETLSQWYQNGYVGAELKLAVITQANHQYADAINHYQRVLELNTNSVTALNNLALLLATASDPRLRNGNEAVRLAERACQSTQYKEAVLIYTLSTAYAEAGRFDDAVVAARKSRAVALAHGQTETAAKNEQLLELYKSGRAYHQEAETTP